MIGPGTKTRKKKVNLEKSSLSVNQQRVIRDLMSKYDCMKKLVQYIKDPYSMDNKGSLKKAKNDQIRENIINT